MNTNKIVIYVTIIAITLIIFVPTFYKVVSINQQRLNEVNEKLVTENAFRCYYEGKCQNKIVTLIVTLNELYNLGYITQDIVNPKTKEIYSKDSFVEISLNEMKLTYK